MVPDCVCTDVHGSLTPKNAKDKNILKHLTADGLMKHVIYIQRNRVQP